MNTQAKREREKRLISQMIALYCRKNHGGRSLCPECAALDAVLPLLPAFPFLLLAAFCFGRSSKKLHAWFTGTKLYKDNLESYVQGKGMTRKTKIRIMVTVTILMSIGFLMMHQVTVGRIVLFCVWVFHVLYFLFGIKTIRPEPTN